VELIDAEGLRMDFRHPARFHPGTIAPIMGLNAVDDGGRAGGRSQRNA